jgi:hypothetical protein
MSAVIDLSVLSGTAAGIIAQQRKLTEGELCHVRSDRPRMAGRQLAEPSPAALASRASALGRNHRRQRCLPLASHLSGTNAAASGLGHRRRNRGGPGRRSIPGPGSVTTQNKTDFSVNGFWTGGYENECHWHTKLMAVVEAEPLPLAEFLLGIVFAVLAIVVKLEITAKMYPSTAIAEDDSRQPDYDPP